MANKKDEFTMGDLLQGFRDLKVQYFLLENLITGEKRVYEGLRGIVLHKNIISQHGPESAKITRLDPDIGKLLYGKQKEENKP